MFLKKKKTPKYIIGNIEISFYFDKEKSDEENPDVKSSNEENSDK